MPRLTRFEEYRDRYPDFALEKTDDGILLLRMHRDGGPAVWDSRTHHDIANLFNDVAGDRDVRVVIYTGTGDAFNATWGQEGERPSFKASAEWAEEMGWYGRLRHLNLLEIDAIMIAAVNGASNIHSELALMCDLQRADDKDASWDSGDDGQDAGWCLNPDAPASGCLRGWHAHYRPPRQAAGSPHCSLTASVVGSSLGGWRHAPLRHDRPHGRP